jgi:hypothetical protein
LIHGFNQCVEQAADLEFSPVSEMTPVILRPNFAFVRLSFGFGPPATQRELYRLANLEIAGPPNRIAWWFGSGA